MFKDNKVAWGIAGAALLGVAALIIILALKNKKDDTTGNSSSPSSPSSPSSQPQPPSRPPPYSPPPSSPSSNTCFYTDCSTNCAMCKGAHSMVDDLVCSKHLTQKECMGDIINHCGLLTDSPDLMKCLPCYLKQDPTRALDGGQCEELLNGVNSQNVCSGEYQKIYDANCSSKNDPVIHNNNNGNKIPCGQDCGASNMEKCYTDFLNSNNMKCEFAARGESGNSGNFLENCMTFANSQNLLCNSSVQGACLLPPSICIFPM